MEVAGIHVGGYDALVARKSLLCVFFSYLVNESGIQVLDFGERLDDVISFDAFFVDGFSGFPVDFFTFYTVLTASYGLLIFSTGDLKFVGGAVFAAEDSADEEVGVSVEPEEGLFEVFGVA